MCVLYKVAEVTSPVEILPKISMGPKATKQVRQGEKGMGNSVGHFADEREQ